jgi:hypothetical protein
MDVLAGHLKLFPLKSGQQTAKAISIITILLAFLP